MSEREAREKLYAMFAQWTQDTEAQLADPNLDPTVRSALEEVHAYHLKYRADFSELHHDARPDAGEQPTDGGTNQ